MNTAVLRLRLDRGRLGTRGWTLTPPAVRRNAGDLVAKFAIVALFSSMAVRLAQDSARSGHVTGLLLLVSEALVVALTIFRRSAARVDRSNLARLVTAFSTFGPPLVKPQSLSAMLPDVVTVLISATGLLIVIAGKISLGRSFGLVPANRGVVSTGLYQFLRHPIYLGYLITHLGFVIANPLNWNWTVLLAADAALMFRAVLEEQTLAADPAYREYMQHTRWRVIPGVF